jgi:hypothetical protein
MRCWVLLLPGTRSWLRVPGLVELRHPAGPAVSAAVQGALAGGWTPLLLRGMGQQAPAQT